MRIGLSFNSSSNSLWRELSWNHCHISTHLSNSAQFRWTQQSYDCPVTANLSSTFWLRLVSIIFDLDYTHTKLKKYLDYFWRNRQLQFVPAVCLLQMTMKERLQKRSMLFVANLNLQSTRRILSLWLYLLRNRQVLLSILLTSFWFLLNCMQNQKWGIRC